MDIEINENQLKVDNLKSQSSNDSLKSEILNGSEPVNKKLKLSEVEANVSTVPTETENKSSLSKIEETESAPEVKKIDPSTSKVEESELSTSKLEKNESSISKVGKDEPSSSKVEESQPSTSKVEESEPSTSKAEKSQPSTSKFEKSKPSTSKIEKGDCEMKDDEDVQINSEPEIPEPGFVYPLEMDSSDMLEEVDFPDGRWPSVTERYFTPYYQLNVQKPGDDVCIYVHSNRICMITIAPSHIIFEEKKKIVSCNFKVSEKLDRTKNKVSGKAKRGAQPLQQNSNLCCLTCSDGTSYMVKCCMIGKLVEVNENLIEDPEQLRKEPHWGGYVAIALPNLRHLDKLKAQLLNQEQYEEAIKKRKEEKEKDQVTNTEVKQDLKVGQIDMEIDAHQQEKQNDNTETKNGEIKKDCTNTVVVEKQENQNNKQSNEVNTTTNEIIITEKEKVESMEIGDS